jgi:hypothetical protein
MTRERLPDRRLSESFSLDLHGLRYFVTFSRRALLRDAQGRASTPLGAAIDVIAGIRGQP